MSLNCISRLTKKSVRDCRPTLNQTWSQRTSLDLVGCLLGVTLTVFLEINPWRWEKRSQTHDNAMRSRAREPAEALCMCAVTETRGYFCPVYERRVVSQRVTSYRGGRTAWGSIQGPRTWENDAPHWNQPPVYFSCLLSSVCCNTQDFYLPPQACNSHLTLIQVFPPPINKEQEKKCRGLGFSLLFLGFFNFLAGNTGLNMRVPKM